MPERFNLQGHRGARGLKPENTLPSFEVAFDIGVSSIETDVHLTQDSRVVIRHDGTVEDLPLPGVSRIREVTLSNLREVRIDCNPRFPTQDAGVTPLAARYAAEHEIHPYAIPTLDDLFAFTAAYAGEVGVAVGKTKTQRQRAQRVIFDIELKCVGPRQRRKESHFDDDTMRALESAVVGAVQNAGAVGRTTVRSFDHRCVRNLRRLEPGLTGAVLIEGTTPVAPAELTRAADAAVYCPQWQWIDEAQVRECQAAGIQVIPWTVNEPADWRRLIDWGVDGITTDYPDRLAELLHERGIVF